MNVRNCRKCGKLFNYLTGMPICPACREMLDEKFKEVKEYIRENPRVGIKEVSEKCEVEVAQIQQWIREERLEFAEGSVMMINCESCGAPIKSGRYCDSCKSRLTNGFSQAMRRPEAPQSAKKDEKTSPKMRFLG